MRRCLFVLLVLSIYSFLSSSNNEYDILGKGARTVIKSEEDNVVKLATWNIGHFSNGSKKDSKINSKNHDVKLNQYREFVMIV